MSIDLLLDDTHVILWDFIVLHPDLSFKKDPIAIVYNETRKLRSKSVD